MKTRKIQIILTATLPKGMTVAQARRAYWNDGFNGTNASRYDTVDVDVSDYIDGARGQRPMKVRLGRASMVKS